MLTAVKFFIGCRGHAQQLAKHPTKICSVVKTGEPCDISDVSGIGQQQLLGGGDTLFMQRICQGHLERQTKNASKIIGIAVQPFRQLRSTERQMKLSGDELPRLIGQRSEEHTSEL